MVLEDPPSFAWADFGICEFCIEALTSKQYAQVGQNVRANEEVTQKTRCALCTLLPQARDQMIKSKNSEHYDPTPQGVSHRVDSL